MGTGAHFIAAERSAVRRSSTSGGGRTGGSAAPEYRGRVSDRPELRVSDNDREATVARLRVAGGEGRLTLEELAERVELADSARTQSDLDALTSDLPVSYSAAAVE